MAITKKPFKPRRRRVRKTRMPMTVARVKKICNSSLMKVSEKKKSYEVVYNEPLGQITQNSPGYFSIELTPHLTLGTASNNNRIGRKVRFTGCYIKYQLLEQGSNTAMGTNFKFMIVKQKNICDDDDFATGNANNPVEKMFINNSFIRTDLNADAQIKDYSSQRNITHFKDFQVLKSKSVYLRPDQIASTNNRIRNGNLAVKFRKPLVTTYNGENDPVDTRIFLVAFASAGNNGAASTLTNVPTTTSYSGYRFSMETSMYFVDV